MISIERRLRGRAWPRHGNRLRRVVIRLVEVAQGLGRPARGGCFGDPVAWEFDCRQRGSERGTAGRARPLHEQPVVQAPRRGGTGTAPG